MFSLDWNLDTDTQISLIGNAFSSMVNLESISIFYSPLNDEFLKHIGSSCNKLKYLGIASFSGVTDVGIRALCDPLMVGFGKCTQLRHFRAHAFFTPEMVSILLLNCPDLEKLTCYGNETIFVAATIAAIDSSFAAELWRNEADCITLPSDIVAATTTSFGNNEQRVFKLKTFGYSNVGATIFHAPLLKALSKYCPFIEEIYFGSGFENLIPGDLDGLFSLPLQSISWADEPNDHMISLNLIMLLRSVCNTLTDLNLSGTSSIDLRVISRECPNLTSLTISLCNTMGGTLANYDIDEHELFTARFGSLTSVTLNGVLIEDRNLISLLSSPILEHLDLDRYYNDSNLLSVISLVLNDYPDAFRNLQTLSFWHSAMDREILTALLERAPVLTELVVNYCFVLYNEERFVAFDEQAYFDELVRLRNWSLKCSWDVIHDRAEWRDASGEAQ